MVKRFKLSAYAAALAAVSLLAMGCTLGTGFGWSTNLDNVPRIITAILYEDLFS